MSAADCRLRSAIEWCCIACDDCGCGAGPVEAGYRLAAPEPQSSILARCNLRETTMPGIYPLPTGDLKSLGFANKPLDHLDALIRSHIDQGRYPGAQIALARHGKLALFRTYGDAKTEGGKLPATNETLFSPVQPDQSSDLVRRFGPWSKKASCPSWTRFRNICRNSPPMAKPTLRSNW